MTDKKAPITDKQRLDWLEEKAGCGLINDDAGHWAISNSGIQNLPPMDGNPIDIASTFFVEKQYWHNSIREAIDYAMEHENDE
jgi:hypothetical protein